MEADRALGDARRILVYGLTGSGKTTPVERLAERTQIRWHSVDDLAWERGWVAVPQDEQRRRIEAICQQPEWVRDTAYGAWLDVPLRRAELIVALDYPRWFSLQRLVRRTAARLLDRREICNGNRESLRTLLSRDAIVVWHLRSFARGRIRQWCCDPAAPVVLRLTSSRQTERWLDGLRDEDTPPHPQQTAKLLGVLRDRGSGSWLAGVAARARGRRIRRR